MENTTYVELKTLFGIVTVQDADNNGIDYLINGERVVNQGPEELPDLETMELYARFIAAGLGAGFGIGRMSAA